MFFFHPDKTSVFLKDPTDVMTYMYGDNIVTTNGKMIKCPLWPQSTYCKNHMFTGGNQCQLLLK